MKTIQILKTLINTLYILMLITLGVAILFLITLLFFADFLPFYLQGYRMLFSNLFSIKMFIGPSLIAINYLLFILAIFYLRKCINPLSKSDFYSVVLYKNLNKSGKLFTFIGVSTILIKIISALIMSSVMQQIIPDLGNSLIIYLGIIISAFELTSVFLIIIGLFFMMFSKSFENAKELQLENDLTI